MSKEPTKTKKMTRAATSLPELTTILAEQIAQHVDGDTMPGSLNAISGATRTILAIAKFKLLVSQAAIKGMTVDDFMQIGVSRPKAIASGS